jgi:hypothetical protein
VTDHAGNRPQPDPSGGDDYRCAVCERVPTRTVAIERNVGLVFFRKKYRRFDPLCREHGLTAAKKYLGLTLVGGWWGVISFFANPLAIAADIRAILAFRRLPDPVAKPYQRERPTGERPDLSTRPPRGRPDPQS